MALKKYDVTVNGQEATLLLSDEDAKARGLLKPEAKKEPEPSKARTPRNKARGAENKSDK